jgi:hypothetical protein
MERTNNAEGLVLLGYDALSYGKWFPTNERNVQPSSSWPDLSLNMTAQRTFEMPETTNHITRRHKPEDLNPPLHNCEMLKTPNSDAPLIFFYNKTAPCGPGLPCYRGLTITHTHTHTHTLRHTQFGRTLLDEQSGRSMDLCLKKRNTRKRQLSMPPARFEPAIPASKRPQTHRSAIGIGCPLNIRLLKRLRNKTV